MAPSLIVTISSPVDGGKNRPLLTVGSVRVSLKDRTTAIKDMCEDELENKNITPSPVQLSELK